METIGKCPVSFVHKLTKFGLRLWATCGLDVPRHFPSVVSVSILHNLLLELISVNGAKLFFQELLKRRKF